MTTQTEPLLGDGDAVRFRIINAEHTTSKAGNEMLRLKLEVKNKEGAGAIMMENVMLNGAARLGAFLRAIGKPPGQRQDPATWAGITGAAVLGFEEAQGQWPAKWRIAKWGSGPQTDITPVRLRQPAGDPITRAEGTRGMAAVVAHAARLGVDVPMQPMDKTLAEMSAGTGWAAPKAAPPSAAPMDDVPF